MIGRLLSAAALLITMAVGLGLAGWLELERGRGTQVFLPVEVMSSESDLVHLANRDPVGEALVNQSGSWALDRLKDALSSTDEDPAALVLTLDERGQVTGAEAVAEPPTDGRVWLKIRDRRTIAPMSTRLPVSDHGAVRYLEVRATSAGEAYEVGLADENLQLLGRGGRAW